MPDDHIHELWRMSAVKQVASGCRIGGNYPAPVVDHEVSAREARRRIGAVRRTPDARAQSREVFREHGSRRRGPGVRAQAGDSTRGRVS